ncbi:hypothetical protein, partial [Mycoplasmopsis arginini]|uniref:hypothetical protein n=1 Tax=Mycoplasmopsis arginini TaxID=2094 RepID=UPI00249EC74C
RKGAVTDEILATFRRLGSECTGNDSWSPKVNEGNCWGNGTHSGWSYLKAWGGYVWEDKHEWLVRDNVREEVGVLADMHKCEEDERRMIRLRLEHLYRANFVKETLSANSLGEVTRALTNLIGKAKGLQTMQKSKTSRHSMIQALEDLKASLTAGVSWG